MCTHTHTRTLPFYSSRPLMMGREVVWLCVLLALGDRQEWGSSSASLGGQKVLDLDPTFLGTIIPAFPSWAVVLEGEKCQSWDCTIQHCSRVKER